MNIYDIAKKTGVSTATVSRYLNGSGYVGKKTRERIAEVIAESGYTPSGFARSLSRGEKMKLFGVIVYRINDLYYAGCAAVLEKALRTAGYEMMLGCAENTETAVAAVTESLIKKNADALIYIGSAFTETAPYITAHIAPRIPCFFINAAVTGNNVFSAFCDDEKATASAAAILAAQRKRPIYLYDREIYGTARKRKGFLSVFPEAGVYLIDDGEPSSRKKLAAILRETDADAIMAANDTLAAIAIRAAHDIGRRVPEDIAVIGHDNSFISELTIPALTSIDNGGEKLAAETAKKILSFFQGEKFTAETEIEAVLKRRESF